MTSRSWQCISCHWDACSKHLAIRDLLYTDTNKSVLGHSCLTMWMQCTIQWRFDIFRHYCSMCTYSHTVLSFSTTEWCLHKAFYPLDIRCFRELQNGTCSITSKDPVLYWNQFWTGGWVTGIWVLEWTVITKAYFKQAELGWMLPNDNWSQ